MSQYVQTLSADDQAILNHAAFRPSTRRFIEIEAGMPIRARWFNSDCVRPLPDPQGDLPSIRYEDIVAFREIWIRHGLQNISAPLRGYFTAARWDQHEGVYRALIVAYRTFKLLVYSDTPVDGLEFSTVDIDQVLTSYLESFRGDETPPCSGEWARGVERVEWHVEPASSERIGRMISSNRDHIYRVARKELVKQCDVVLALRSFYRPVQDGLDPDELQRNLLTNEWLEATVSTRLELSAQMFRCLPSHSMPVGECARAGFLQLLEMFQASRSRFAALNCASFQLPELSVLLGEGSDDDFSADSIIYREPD